MLSALPIWTVPGVPGALGCLGPLLATHVWTWEVHLVPAVILVGSLSTEHWKHSTQTLKTGVRLCGLLTNTLQLLGRWVVTKIPLLNTSIILKCQGWGQAAKEQ